MNDSYIQTQTLALMGEKSELWGIYLLVLIQCSEYLGSVKEVCIVHYSNLIG